MIKLVENLAQPFVYVRVDMYDFEDEIYFGEITFHHGSGYERLDPMEWDYKLGDLVDLTKISQKPENA